MRPNELERLAQFKEQVRSLLPYINSIKTDKDTADYEALLATPKAKKPKPQRLRIQLSYNNSRSPIEDDEAIESTVQLPDFNNKKNLEPHLGISRDTSSDFHSNVFLTNDRSCETRTNSKQNQTANASPFLTQMNQTSTCNFTSPNTTSRSRNLTVHGLSHTHSPLESLDSGKGRHMFRMTSRAIELITKTLKPQNTRYALSHKRFTLQNLPIDLSQVRSKINCQMKQLSPASKSYLADKDKLRLENTRGVQVHE